MSPSTHALNRILKAAGFFSPLNLRLRECVSAGFSKGWNQITQLKACESLPTSDGLQPLIAMASNLLEMASNLIAMASNLLAMASNL